MSEDRMSRRCTGLHYGATQNTPLSFHLIFGVDGNDFAMDRFELMRIAGWLTGHKQYKWLQICQPDLDMVRWRCLITDLEQIEVSGLQVAFDATVLCDGPYAYMLPSEHYIVSHSTTEYLYRNPSNINDFYYPKFEITCAGTQEIRIVNKNEPGREFVLSGLASFSGNIYVDSQNELITTNNGTSIYDMSNFVFPRTTRGENILSITGSCTIKMSCEEPVNVGF